MKRSIEKHSVKDSLGVVSSGHPLTSRAACEMLRRGGNAFDAVISAAFATTVTEPCLASLGGGGFLLIHNARSGQDVLYDFFVTAPGLGHAVPSRPSLEAVDIHFASSTQVFHVGAASVAVPGVLKGLMKCYVELCSLELEDILAPALDCLQDGVEINDLHQYLFRMLMPILVRSEYGREIYAGREEGGKLFNPMLQEFLKERSCEKWFNAVYGDGAAGLEAQLAAGNGLLTARDLFAYRVERREPLRTQYRGYDIVTNPPPSFGGSLLALAFESLSRTNMATLGDTERCLALADVMNMMNRHRSGTTGTTHISVIDAKGNAASLTVSNGSNSGIFIGDTGIMLNNMMGEDDLFPGGFHSMPPGKRVGSMMSPTLIRRNGRIYAVLGSGGSKRIRTALLQVIHNLIDQGLPVAEAIEAPRIHLDDEGVLQVEPGFSRQEVQALEEKWPLNMWGIKDLYFGGVHTVMGSLEGHGDSRRGGSCQRI